MRIVVVDDFHMKNDELDLTEQAIEDMANCSADLVVPLGDFGSNDKIGRPEGLRQAFDYLSRLNTKIVPILGNHDLERESGKDLHKQGNIQKKFKELYDLNETYQVLEYNDFRLIFLSTDPQPKDSCYEVQECFVSDEQFSWLEKTISKRQGIPIIMFTHAPPIGSGLRTVPDVHVRATNAFLDQNHDPYRWIKLAQTHEEIVMWFSAHFHLGHQHEDSHVTNYGTTFFTTGVHGSATRDHKRQSRVIDISRENVSVSTLDHSDRKIYPSPDWSFAGNLQQLINFKQMNLHKTSHQFNVSKDKRVERIISCSAGNINTKPFKIASTNEETFLIASDDGYLWELDTSVNAILGTHHLGKSLTDFAYSSQQVWRAWDHYISCHSSTNINRFVRRHTEDLPPNTVSLRFPIISLTSLTDGKILVASNNEVFELSNDQGNIIVKEKPIMTFAEDIIHIKSDQDYIICHTSEGNLFQWIKGEIDPKLLLQEVVSWDIYKNHIVALLKNQDIKILQIDHHKKVNIQRVDVSSLIKNKTDLTQTKLLYLGNRNIVFVCAGKASIWIDKYKEWHLLDHQREVFSVSRCQNPLTFALGVKSDGDHDFHRLEIWEMNA